MTPLEIESLLRDAGVCFEFSYRYPTGLSRDAGSATVERWCTAPQEARSLTSTTRPLDSCG
jgi:hypothetical protein